MAEKEYIEREATIAKMKANSLKIFNQANNNISMQFYKGYIRALQDLREMPTADTTSVFYGRWIWKSNYRDYDGDICSTHSCSNCKHKTSDTTPYCPKCGAKMSNGDDTD